MKVIVNGLEREVNESHLDGALKDLSLDLSYAAIALNGKCIPKSQFNQTKITEGDVLEVLVPQAGG